MKPNRTLCAIACVIAAACGMTACTQNGPYGGTRPGTTEPQTGALPSPMTDASSRYDTRSPMGGVVPAPSSSERRNPGAQPAPAY
ncbi:hypothetical protein GR157_11335 [Burkholderia sp. 4701]|nr:hypothetical protein [Burkholderia sp. 4701]MXN82482.1 hypothetical protein [Burkholderia sp. 4812]